MGLDCSITNRKGCNYCGRGKIINTNGTDFTISHFTDLGRDEHFIQTINDNGNYYSLDIRYCPICGKPLHNNKEYRYDK